MGYFCNINFVSLPQYGQTWTAEMDVFVFGTSDRLGQRKRIVAHKKSVFQQDQKKNFQRLVADIMIFQKAIYASKSVLGFKLGFRASNEFGLNMKNIEHVKT